MGLYTYMVTQNFNAVTIIYCQGEVLLNLVVKRAKISWFIFTPFSPPTPPPLPTPPNPSTYCAWNWEDCAHSWICYMLVSNIYSSIIVEDEYYTWENWKALQQDLGRRLFKVKGCVTLATNLSKFLVTKFSPLEISIVHFLHLFFWVCEW